MPHDVGPESTPTRMLHPNNARGLRVLGTERLQSETARLRIELGKDIVPHPAIRDTVPRFMSADQEATLARPASRGTLVLAALAWQQHVF